MIGRYRYIYRYALLIAMRRYNSLLQFADTHYRYKCVDTIIIVAGRKCRYR